MTDEFAIQVIARRLDDEVPWSKGATIFKHADWVDVVQHLWADKHLKLALLEAYQEDLVKAHAHWLMAHHECEADRMPL